MGSVVIWKEKFCEAKLLGTTLAARGFSVITPEACTNRSLRAAALGQQPGSIALIITHEAMRGLSGQALAALYEHKTFAPVILLHSGHDSYDHHAKLGPHFLEIRYCNHAVPFMVEVITQLISSGAWLAAHDKKSKKLLTLLCQVATQDIFVLISGAAGSGKEVLAHHLHKSSLRHGGPFLGVHCGAVSEKLLELILFGSPHSGRHADKVCCGHGLLMAANGGTLVLDEVTALSGHLQQRILEVINHGGVVPLGGKRRKPLNIRLVGLTTANVSLLVKKGLFSKELYEHFSGAPLQALPLKERPRDILPLSVALLYRHAQNICAVPYIAPQALQALEAHSWPDNVRELEWVLRRALLLSQNRVITNKDIIMDDLVPEPLRRRALPGHHATAPHAMIYPPDRDFASSGALASQGA